MGANTQKGFTIIEVTLFLGLTGLLAVLLLGGWTLTLNSQRYRDSIKTTQSFIQQQYNLVYNVENGRGTNLTCNSEATVSESESESNPPRGQAECVLMGRYIHVKDGRTIDVYPIVGREPSTEGQPNDSDIAVITRYQAKFFTADMALTENQLDIPWQSTVVLDDGSSEPISYAIAIIRSPESGVVRTFASDPLPDGGLRPTVEELVRPSNERDTKLCLDPGVPLSGSRLGVVILKGASSQNFVEPIYEQQGDIRC